MVTRRKKSLRELFSNQDSKTGTGVTKVHGSKKIRSPGGQERYVPGYTVDYEAQSDVKVTRFDSGKWSNNNWNTERFNNFETVNENTIFAAVPRRDAKNTKKPVDKT